MNLHWTEVKPPTHPIMANHIEWETPLGFYRISWRDDTPHLPYKYVYLFPHKNARDGVKLAEEDTVGDAKIVAESHFYSKVKDALWFMKRKEYEEIGGDNLFFYLYSNNDQRGIPVYLTPDQFSMLKSIAHSMTLNNTTAYQVNETLYVQMKEVPPISMIDCSLSEELQKVLPPPGLKDKLFQFLGVNDSLLGKKEVTAEDVQKK